MKKVSKVMSLLVMMLMLSFCTLASFSFADPPNTGVTQPGGTTTTGGTSGTTAGFDPTGIKNSIVTNAKTAPTDTSGEAAIKKLSGTALWTLKFIGFILGVVLITWYGIKWMTSGPTEKAQLKDQAWNYVIGAVLLFGAAPLAGWIYNMVQGFNT